jgi:hypothetical protein
MNIHVAEVNNIVGCATCEFSIRLNRFASFGFGFWIVLFLIRNHTVLLYISHSFIK